MTMRVAALLTAGLWFAGCGGKAPAADLGQRLFDDRTLSTSPYNVFSCGTCHAVGTSPPVLSTQGPHPGPIHPGYDLHDSVYRPGWWGGYETRLLDAMNYCLTGFMGGGALAEDDPKARELYEYLAAHSPDNPSPALPLTIVKNVTALSDLAGDAKSGEDVYRRACLTCHGAPHTGAGKLGPKVSTIPEDTLAVFPTSARGVVVEKVRHGKFFNVGGLMPLYSEETLSDQELADVLAYLGL